jgi:PadR family transcriptional regulator, regulatory protein PadR
MNPTKSDLPQGTLDLLILKVVALGPVHGYAIAQRLDQVSRGVVQVPQGSLYPALHRLENRGLLAADWKVTETGREAKFYRLTRKGRAQLETESQSWQRLAEAVSLYSCAFAGIRASVFPRRRSRTSIHQCDFAAKTAPAAPPRV